MPRLLRPAGLRQGALPSRNRNICKPAPGPPEQLVRGRPRHVRGQPGPLEQPAFAQSLQPEHPGLAARRVLARPERPGPPARQVAPPGQRRVRWAGQGRPRVRPAPREVRSANRQVRLVLVRQPVRGQQERPVPPVRPIAGRLVPAQVAVARHQGRRQAPGIQAVLPERHARPRPLIDHVLANRTTKSSRQPV